LEAVSLAWVLAHRARLEPISVTFKRNDNNVWAKSVPTLAEYLGSWLRGTLSQTSSGLEAIVTLEPLAGGAPGWRHGSSRSVSRNRYGQRASSRESLAST
jgi:hypothetical protein